MSLAAKSWSSGWVDSSYRAVAEPAGGWQWITGEPFVYTNWQHGEPNNSGGSENNLEIASLNFSPLGQWNDLDGQNPPAGWSNGYIVEYSPEPSTFALASMSIAVLLITDSRYRYRQSTN